MQTTPRHLHGFTLIELAIVLVIIGLIFGLVIKGSHLIDGAKIKNTWASVNKIRSALNIYYERYGVYPGDESRNGTLDNDEEYQAFWQHLIDQSKLLNQIEKQTPFGSPWSLNKGDTSANTDADTIYLNARTIGEAAVDIRYVCSLDQQFDDGTPDTGDIRSNASTGTGNNQYQTGIDCWNRSGLASLSIRLLP